MMYAACFIIFSSLIVATIEMNNFGPYKIEWEKFEICTGPKQNECGNFIIENAQNMSNVRFKIDMVKDCYVTKAKVTTGLKENSLSTKKTWNYSLNKPCTHFVFGSVLIEAFNVTNNCRIKKGKYEVHVNVNEKSKAFFGASFFYGTYELKITAHNSISNFICVHTIMNVEKLN